MPPIYLRPTTVSGDREHSVNWVARKRDMAASAAARRAAYARIREALA